MAPYPHNDGMYKWKKRGGSTQLVSIGRGGQIRKNCRVTALLNWLHLARLGTSQSYCPARLAVLATGNDAVRFFAAGLPADC